MTLGNSKFEMDMSNMQLSCSMIFDLEEKSKLVYELYCKKIMFKCFANWANYQYYESSEDTIAEESMYEDFNYSRD